MVQAENGGLADTPLQTLDVCNPHVLVALQHTHLQGRTL